MLSARGGGVESRQGPERTPLCSNRARAIFMVEMSYSTPLTCKGKADSTRSLNSSCSFCIRLCFLVWLTQGGLAGCALGRLLGAQDPGPPRYKLGATSLVAPNLYHGGSGLEQLWGLRPKPLAQRAKFRIETVSIRNCCKRSICPGKFPGWEKQTNAARKGRRGGGRLKPDHQTSIRSGYLMVSIALLQKTQEHLDLGLQSFKESANRRGRA